MALWKLAYSLFSSRSLTSYVHAMFYAVETIHKIRHESELHQFEFTSHLL